MYHTVSKQKNLPFGSSDLSPADFSLWGASQQELYRQTTRDAHYLKRVLLQCWVHPINHDTKKGHLQSDQTNSYKMLSYRRETARYSFRQK